MITALVPYWCMHQIEQRWFMRLLKMNQKQLAIYNLLKTLKTVEEAKAVKASKPVEESEPLDC